MKDTALTMKYRELDRDLAKLHYLLTSENEFETEVYLPTDENIAAARSELASLRARVDAIEAPDKVYAAIKHQMQDFADSEGYAIDGIEASRTAPIGNLGHFIENQARHMRKSPETIIAKIKTKYDNAVALGDQIIDLLLEKTPANRYAGLKNLYAFNLEILKEYYDNRMERSFGWMLDAQIARIKESLKAVIDMFEAHMDRIPVDQAAAKKEADDLNLTMKMTYEEYKKLLHDKLGVELDDMLTWYEKEVEETRNEVFEIASHLPIEEPAPTTMEEVNDILFKYSAPKSTPEEMIEKGVEYLAKAKAYAKQVIFMPEDEECMCVPTVYACKDSFPWGGYEGGDFSVRPYIGHMFLNEYNYNNITDAWIKMDSMHEAYPGHHCQMVRAAHDPLPEIMKIGAKNIPLLEGTCLRTERAFEDCYGDDPFYLLHIAYRRHHTATRILVDLTMNYYGGTIGDLVEIYKKELGLDFVTARGQVLAHQNMRGYFTCYYYGMKKLTQWEKELGFGKKEYTEFLFSSGFVSMDTFRMYLEFTTEERERYHKEFKSLYMD